MANYWKLLTVAAAGWEGGGKRIAGHAGLKGISHCAMRDVEYQLRVMLEIRLPSQLKGIGADNRWKLL